MVGAAFFIEGCYPWVMDIDKTLISVVVAALLGTNGLSTYKSHEAANVAREAQQTRQKMDANMLLAMSELRELNARLDAVALHCK